MVRATSVGTPADAGPLVMTTGSDLPSSVQLPVWLSRTGPTCSRPIPIVAVDRRGMGMSSDLDCRDLFDRQEMLDQAQFESGDDPVANLGAIVQTATTSCTDTIAPGDSAYDNAHAAEDIERLRSTWDVPTLALLGIGNGAQVALAYAGSHPNKVSRLILDSPLPLGHRRRGRRRTEGQGSAGGAGRVRRTVRRAPDCPLGLRPEGRRRRAAGGPHATAAGPAVRRSRRWPTPSPPRWPSRAVTASARPTASPAPWPPPAAATTTS